MRMHQFVRSHSYTLVKYFFFYSTICYILMVNFPFNLTTPYFNRRIKSDCLTGDGQWGSVVAAALLLSLRGS